MTLPSRKQQIERVIDLLEQSEEKTLGEIAETIVDGYLDLLSSSIKKPALNPEVGMAFKHPALSGVWFVAYDMGSTYWIVSGTSKYGFMVHHKSEVWQYAEQSTAKTGAPGNNPHWSVGQKVSRRQRQFVFEIVATMDKGVLLKDTKSNTYLADSNENMERYYRKESDFEW